MALFATGNILGFSSVTIPTLLSSDSQMKADQDDMSWMGTVATITEYHGPAHSKSIFLNSLFYSI